MTVLVGFKARVDALSKAQNEVRLWCGEHDKMGFHCMRVGTKIDMLNGGAHSTGTLSCCGDYKPCKKCEQKCDNRPWNSDAVDVNLKLRAARHDRNWAIINLFFVTRKGAQLLKYVYLKHKVAKLSRECKGLSDKVIEMKPGGAQGAITLGEDGPNDVDLPGNESAGEKYQGALDIAGQKKAEYDNAVAQMNVAWKNLLGHKM